MALEIALKIAFESAGHQHRNSHASWPAGKTLYGLPKPCMACQSVVAQKINGVVTQTDDPCVFNCARHCMFRTSPSAVVMPANLAAGCPKPASITVLSRAVRAVPSLALIHEPWSCAWVDFEDNFVPPLSELIVLCRTGFEAEAAQELINQAAGYDMSLESVGKAEAIVRLRASHGDTKALVQQLDFRDLIFARQWFACMGEIDLPKEDRLSPLIEAARSIGVFGNVWFENADTNDGNSLVKLAQSLYKPLNAVLKKEDLVQPGKRARLHIVLTSGTSAFVGISYPPNSASSLGGIARLKVAREAPSRSTAKLDEAIHWFCEEGKGMQSKLFVPGTWAVDLGAAPGGWTYQLVQRGINVMAVDNGPMDVTLMKSGFVRHFQKDGYSFQPPKPVEWMVCDIADKPARTIDMVAQWLIKGWCHHTIFNLKLPMKQRYDEVQHLLSRLSKKIAKEMPQAELTLKAKQLYHNREEITVFAAVAPARQSSSPWR